MGNEGGEAAAPQPSPAETVTVKPAQVSRDPEQTTDDPVTRGVEARTASEIDRDTKPSRPKQKRKTKPVTADISDPRSPGARSKASKLAKSSKAEVDALSEPHPGSGSSPRRSRTRAEDSVSKPLRERDPSSSEATAVTAHEVAPHAHTGRPVRTGVAKAGPGTADEKRASDGVGQPAGPIVSSKTLPIPARAPDVAPAVDARQETTSPVPSTKGTDSQAVTPPPTTPGEVASKALPKTDVETSPATVERPVVAAPPPSPEIGAVVSPANPDTGASQAAVSAPAMVTGAAAPKDPTTAPDQGVTVVGKAAAPPPPEGRVVGPASAPDTQAAGVASQAAVPPAAMATGEAAPKNPTTALDQGATFVGTAAAPPLPEGRNVGAASEPATQAAGVASQAAVPPPAMVTGAAVSKDAPTTPPQGAAVVDTTAMPSSPEGRRVDAASEPEAPAAEVAPHAAVPPSVAETASTNAPTPLAKETAVGMGAAEGPAAATVVIPFASKDDVAQPVAAPSGSPTPAVSGMSVPVPGQAAVRDGVAPLTAMNEPEAPVSSLNPPALPEAFRETIPDHDGDAERPVSSASNPTKPSVSNGYGALGKIDGNVGSTPAETASILMAPPSAIVPPDENPSTRVKIAIGDISTKPEGTAIAYTITNAAAAPVDLLFIRCNAVDRDGVVVGSAFDYVENIPAGQQVQRVVQMSSEVTASGQTFSCANDAATQ